MDPFNAEFNRMLVATYKSIMKVEELMLRDLSASDITISEMHMLESIASGCEAGMHIGGIAQEQGITLPSVTTAIQKLERKGYVTKQRNAFDARRVLVMLTDKGRRAEIAHRYFHREMVKACARGMDEKERQVLMAGLTKLNCFLNQKAEQSEAASSEGDGK